MVTAPRLTRRAALSGSVLVGAAGCSSTTDTPVARSDARSSASLDTDEAIVSDLVARLTGSTALLTEVRRRYPGLPLRQLIAVQTTHLTTLRGAVTASRLRVPTATPTPVAATRDAALAQVRTDTTTLQQACLDAAARAESGAFARLLASMGCALSQRLQVLARG